VTVAARAEPSEAHPADTSRDKTSDTTIYGAKHKILGLKDEEFLTVDIGTMMSWYGEAKGGGTCAEDFGNKLVDKWRQQKASYCKSETPNPDDHTSIDCYLIHQTRHHGNGDNLCVMKNVAVQLGIFGDDGSTRPIIKRYVDTTHSDQPYIHFSKGFINGDCTPVPEVWNAANFPGWNEDWTTNAYEQIGDILGASKLRGADEGSCDEWIDHPVLIAQRDTFANFFHDSEDFVNVFLSMAILNYNRKNTQILLTDLYPKGPFW
jgi:hypothetical protein